MGGVKIKEFKIKVWDNKDEKMLTSSELGLLPSNHKQDYIIGPSYLLINPNCERFDVLFYTRLKDINQNEVYENDIYKNNENNCIGIFKYDACGLWATEYKDREIYNNLPFRDLDVTDFEIIGNKYENPKLLK